MNKKPTRAEINAHLKMLKDAAIDDIKYRYTQAQTADEQYSILAEAKRKFKINLLTHIKT